MAAYVFLVQTQMLALDAVDVYASLDWYTVTTYRSVHFIAFIEVKYLRLMMRRSQ